MTSFYDKYYLNNLSSKSKSTNILKTDYTLEYTDYQKLKIAEQYNKLYNEIYNVNKDNIVSKENDKIYNLSFNKLFQNAGKVYIDIINDLAIFFSVNIFGCKNEIIFCKVTDSGMVS
jgi:hypothetical protein